MTFSKRENYGDREHTICQGLEVWTEGVSMMAKHKRVLGGNATVLYPHCGGSYTNLYVYL